MRSLGIGVALSFLACGSPQQAGISADDVQSDSGGSGGIATTHDSGTGGKASPGTGGTTTGTGGAKGTGGASTDSGGATGTGGSSGTGGSAPHNVGACDGLGAVGAWEQITPPGVSLPGPADAAFGTNRFAVDPTNAGTLYLGTTEQGIWKTTDCGATWIHVNTGRNGKSLDVGRQWTVVIDPVDPQVMYANAGYGSCVASTGLCSSGLFKSTNAGVDWDEVWPHNAPDPKSANGFVGDVRMDPKDHLHLLLGFHEAGGIAESNDAGASWQLVAGWDGAGSWFLDSTTWLSSKNGLWRTTDGGKNWNQVSDANSSGHQTGFLFHAANGAYYLGAQEGIVRSVDGVAWSIVPKSGQLVKGVIGDGTTMYASGFATCFDFGTNLQPFMTSQESDGLTWKTMASPPKTEGSDFIGYDTDHHVLYSSECQHGFWRVRTR
jgi:hypothetical protein